MLQTACYSILCYTLYIILKSRNTDVAITCNDFSNKIRED